MTHLLRRRAMALFCRTPLFRISLAGAAPRELAQSLAIRWPGDAKRGAALLEGIFQLAGETVRQPSPLGAPAGAGEAWLVEFHGFAWLADLSTLGSAAARDAGRAAIAAWLAENARWHALAWRADVLAARLAAWVTQFESFFPATEATDDLRDAVLASLARQRRHLARVAGWEIAGAGRLPALKGLILATRALGLGERP